MRRPTYLLILIALVLGPQSSAIADPPPARVSLTRRFLDWTGLSSQLPHTLNGSLSLIQIAGYRLEINPALHDPLTALGTCADLITDCYSPTAPLDQCIATVRACQTQQPWREHPCCPSACRDAYQHQRQTGVVPMTAFQSVYFDQPDCFPGARAMLTRQP